MAINILIFEDDSETLMYTSEFLQDEGMHIYSVESAISGLGILSAHSIDIIILDINLPDYNGFDVCAKIRNESGIPIIIVSGNADIHSRLLAFDKGADDYMIKPIDLRELVARIKAILKRVHNIPAPAQQAYHLGINPLSHTIELDGEPLILTPLENDLLTLLLQHQNQTTPREALYKALPNSNSRTLDYHIKNLRKKIGDDARNPRYLKTEYGVGYRLEC